MRTARDHDEHADNLAPWLLGALPPLEAQRFERHLAGCEACQTEALELRPTVGVLAAAVPAVEPPRELKASVMAAVRAEAHGPARERRLRRPALRPATALAMLAVGVVIGVSGAQVVGDDDERTIAAAVDRTRVPSGTAELHLDGAEARVEMRGLPDPGAGKVWELWIQHGESVRRGPVTRGGEVEIPGGLQGADALLVTRERAGGVDAPTERPVMRFTLS